MDVVSIMLICIWKADLSFTIFLNCKESYEGGELSIEYFNSEEKFKLNEGEIIIYQVHIYIQ